MAALVDAYGIVLVTSRANWPPATRGQARAAFTGFWPEVRMIEGVRIEP